MMHKKFHGLMALLFAGLMTTASAFAQQATPAAKPVAATPTLQPRTAPESEETKSPDSASQQGIKVHGHWVIDVKNPDGTLAQHHEFENSLASAGGGGYLVGLLSGQFSSGNWMIQLAGTSGVATPCVGPSYAICGIVQSLTGSPASYYCGGDQCATTLTVTPNYGVNFAGPYSLVLSGSITAAATGSISNVTTVIGPCAATGYSSGDPTQPSGVAPSACGSTTTSNATAGPFTATSITPIAITSGQLIQVTVTISFS
jgi:hypothetical protein